MSIKKIGFLNGECAVIAFMTDFHVRLKFIRNKKYKSIGKAAIALGLKKSTYAAHESGISSPGIDRALEYSKHFDVNPTWLAWGIGRMVPENHETAKENEIEIHSQIARESVIALLNALDEGEVDLNQIAPRHYDLVGKAVAKLVVESSKFPVAEVLSMYMDIAKETNIE